MLGEIGGVATLSEISLLGMIVGLVLLLGGTAYLRVLGFPITYLAFMLPILEDLVAPLHWPLQLITAQQGVTILQMLGFPALVEQQYVVLPHITLEVAGVCSGVNYLISIAAIGLPLAYLALRKLWSRVALILLAVAIGWMANWLRVVLIGVWTSWGGEGLHGPFHILQGMFVAWVGWCSLLPRGVSRNPSPGVPTGDAPLIRRVWQRLCHPNRSQSAGARYMNSRSMIFPQTRLYLSMPSRHRLARGIVLGGSLCSASPDFW